ncbi:MAG: PIN domain-containing protein [Caldilineaceae bacterium]
MDHLAVADTGFVVALLNQRDRYHSRVSSIYQQQPMILLPQTALTEVAYMVGRDANIPTVIQFLNGLAKSRFTVVALIDEDIIRVSEILGTYIDSKIDFVDATVMAIAERFDCDTVLTIDRRDFQLFRPKHRDYFILLP